MKSALILTALALFGSALFLFNGEQTNTFSQDKVIFKSYLQWKSDFGRNFNGSEDKYRFETFRQNFLYMEEVNNDPSSTIKLAMNQFAAMSNEEYRKIMLIPAPENRYENAQHKEMTVQDVPTSVNWLQKGAVAPVDNQGQCGSCWAFSTKEGLEGIYQIVTGKLVVLSAQQVTDCATNGNMGCNGGEPMNGYAYTQQMGIQTDASYPYVSGNTGEATQCTYNAADVVFKNTGQTLVSPSMNVAAIQAAVMNQPTSIELDGGSAAFQLYSSGILNTNNCGTQLDHAILLVGYDTTGTTPYWLVKNSWGTTWGQQGYAQIAITQDGPGVCGVQQYVAYPSYSQ